MSDDDSGEVDPHIVASHREHLDGHGERDPDAYPHTGTVRDSDLSRFLAVVEQEYDPTGECADPARLPGSARDLELVRNTQRMEATEHGRRALEDGDMGTLQHQQGDTNQRADVSGMKAIQQLDQILESPAPVIVVLGEMGAGKTDFAGLLGQRARHILGVEKVASNIESLQETDPWIDDEGNARDGFVPNHATMMEWVTQDGDPLRHEQSQKLFIGDEFSSHADGSGKSGHLARKKLGPLVYKIRKYDGLLIYIAHDESSIHPLLWRLGVIVKKTDKKTAVVADRVKSGELRDKRFEITGVPPTDWRYDTKEASSWSWTDADTDDTPDPGEVAFDVALWTVRECKQDGLSHRETANYVPFGKSWVGDRWVEIQNDDHAEAMDRVEALTE